MAWVYLISIVIAQRFVSVAQKSYGNKITNGGFSFSAAVIFFQIVFFAVSGYIIEGSLDFTNTAILPYALIFGICFGTAVVFDTLAVLSGPLSITTLFISFSLLIPTFYGIIFNSELPGLFFYIGLAFLIVSLVAVNLKKKGAKEKKTSVKWFIFTMLGFLGNGGCTVSQTAQQKAFNGAYKSELMIIALAFAFIAIIIVAFITEKRSIWRNLKVGLPFHLLYAVSNGFVNLFVMMLTGGNLLPVSVIFPTISAGGILGSALLAMIAYKEKLTKLQIAGIIFGAVAGVFLNL